MASADIEALIRARAPAGMRVLIPPPSLIDMAGEFVEYVEDESLSMRFPVLPRYRNPMGNMQGGFIVAALDNTLGPFAYLIAPPSATSALNTQYLRPVGADAQSITCRAWLVQRTRATLHLAGEARGDDGKVVALCQAVCQVVATG